MRPAALALALLIAACAAAALGAPIHTGRRIPFLLTPQL
jgi:hypothetical protein